MPHSEGKENVRVPNILALEVVLIFPQLNIFGQYGVARITLDLFSCTIQTMTEQCFTGSENGFRLYKAHISCLFLRLLEN